MNTTPRQVGTQDVDKKNSPIAWEAEEVPLEPICYFNGTVFSDGDVIKSGTVLLRCDQGLWVPAGSSEAENI
jgi:hypothetical protein